MECDLIVVVANKGFSEEIMNTARTAGATGGTILSGRGTAPGDVKKFFGITIQEEKEVVLILTKKEIKGTIMSAIYNNEIIKENGRAIVFALPVEDTLGITFDSFSDK